MRARLGSENRRLEQGAFDQSFRRARLGDLARHFASLPWDRNFDMIFPL
jgi:hypothetical protein